MHVISRVALLGALLLMVAACSTDDKIGLEPLVCPTVGVLADASALHVAADGGGTAYNLEFMRAQLLECELKDNRMTATIRFEARAQTGPGVTSNEFSYPYFVALLDPDSKVLSKTVRKAAAKFKSGKTETFFAEEYDDIEFTVPEGKDGLGYEILVGFQLTRQQMEFNRAKAAKPGLIQVPDIVTQ